MLEIGTPLPRLLHVVPVVGPSAPERLHEAQRISLRSIERARDYSREHVAVEVRAARFFDEPTSLADSIVDAPTLRTSSADVGRFRMPRRLPLLREVLDSFRPAEGHEALILTNTDIAVQPMFYELVMELLSLGHDAFTINRQSVSPHFGTGPGAVAVQASVGARHPGTDCFVFLPELLDSVNVGDVLMGAPFVARTLKTALSTRAVRFRAFADLHATYHIGDDRIWDEPRFGDYAAFNQRIYAELFPSGRGRQVSGHVATGRRRVRSTSNTAAASGSNGPRLIFCAAPPRSGTAYLAEVVSGLPRVIGGHEVVPTMSGDWLRDVERLGLSETYMNRRVKPEAIRTTLELRPGARAFVDTSHLFLTMFYDVVLDSFDHSQISIVQLCRNPIDVARSMNELGWFSDANHIWPSWLIDPFGINGGIAIDRDEIVDSLDHAFAYIATILHRRAAVRALTPSVAWVDADLPELTTTRGLRELYRALGFGDSPPGRRRRVNVRRKRKAEIDHPIARSEVQLRLGEFLERFQVRDGVRALGDEVARWERASA